MFSIRGKLLLYALEIVAAVIFLVSTPPWEWWGQAGLVLLSTLAIGLAMLMGRSIANGLDTLVSATRAIAAGHYDQPVRLGGTDEIGVLAGAIDSMRQMLGDKVRQLEDFGHQLERKVEERTAELAEARDRLALLHGATMAVNSSLDLQSIFEAVVTGARRLVVFDQASIARVVDGDSAVIFTIPRDPARDRTIPLRGSHIATVIQARTPAVFDREDHTLGPGASPGVIRREAVIPLLAGEQAIGTLNLGAAGAAAFTDRDLDVLVQIAASLATALLRAETFEGERRAAQELRQLSDLKSDFVAKVSHELRTPLTSILGGIENLLDGIAGPMEEKSRGYLIRIRDNATRLLALIDDLLDLRRIESGGEGVHASHFDLAWLVAEIVENVKPLADRHGIILTASPGARLSVFADREKIRRVLLNLLHNAIKFTERGGRVEVVCALRNAETVELTVRDTGVGISPDELERIFDKFHQVRPGGHRTVTGSGLGLPISRELIRLHGGDLRVASRPGAGSAFTVSLPVAVPAAKGAA